MINTQPAEPGAQDAPPEKRAPEDELEDDAEDAEDGGAPAEAGAGGARARFQLQRTLSSYFVCT